MVAAHVQPRVAGVLLVCLCAAAQRLHPAAPPPRSMFLGRSPTSGARVLPGPLFAALTVLLLGWFGLTFAMTARARRKAAPA